MLQKIITIGLIVVIVLGGGYYAYQQLVPPPEEGAQGPVYSTKPVERGDISVGVETSGPLNPSSGGGIQVPGYYGMSGGISYVIEEVLIKEGDEVKKGQLLVRLDAPDLEAKIKTLEDRLKSDKKSLADLLSISVDQINSLDPSRGIILQAPIDGRIISLDVREGQELKQGQIVAKVVDDSRFRLVAKATIGEFANMEIGNKAILSLPQFDSVVQAEITDLSYEPVAEPASNLMDSLGSGGGGSGANEEYIFVHWVTLEGENPGLVRPGMEARIGISSDPKAEKVDPFTANWLRYYSTIDGYVDEETVYSRAEAIATKVYIKNGQKVEKGDPLVSLAGEDAREVIAEKLNKIREQEDELSQLYSQYDQMDILAPMDGVVAYINTDYGRMMQPGEWLGHIYDTADMRMWCTIDDVDVVMVRQGAPVKVTVDALPGKAFEGEVNRLSTMGKDRDGITRFEVDIKVKGGPDLRPGMQAKAFIDAGSAEDVLLVPLEAIFEEDGQPKVEVLEEDGTITVVSVKLGLMNDRFAEVQEGLEEGQLAVTGSSADILPSQRIQSKDSLLPEKPDEDQNNNGKESQPARPQN